MSSEDVARVLKLLEKVGYEGTPKEFEETLNKFKAHTDAVNALRKGVTRRGKVEDSGSYCENASYGYGDYCKKRNLLEKLDLEDDRVFLKNVDPASLTDTRAPTRGGETMQELREQVRELTERVAILEKRAIRGPSLSPKGPGL
jgi:hypothetical protein